jgi:hypothetical protein
VSSTVTSNVTTPAKTRQISTGKPQPTLTEIICAAVFINSAVLDNEPPLRDVFLQATGSETPQATARQM